MTVNIDQLNEAELAELNQRIVARLKDLQSIHTRREMMQFSVGDNVAFKPPGQERQVGTLVRHNKKTVTVITEGGKRWNVSPNLLNRIQGTVDSGHAEISSHHHWAETAGSNVIALSSRR